MSQGPPPGGLHDLVDLRKLRLPAEDFAGATGVGHEFRRVARSQSCDRLRSRKISLAEAINADVPAEAAANKSREVVQDRRAAQ
jgi:hypothetical protein